MLRIELLSLLGVIWSGEELPILDTDTNLARIKAVAVKVQEANKKRSAVSPGTDVLFLEVAAQHEKEAVAGQSSCVGRQKTSIEKKLLQYQH